MFNIRTLLAAAALGLAATAAHAHELWFQPTSADRDSVRLTFGDTPAPGEAERVAEIARTKVWADGRLLEVERLADGLEVRLPARRPAVLSAYADRGVIDYQGDSFVIHLAAYAQTRPVERGEAADLGLADDQIRLLLVARGKQRPIVRALWKGKPVADAVVEVYRDPAGKPAEVRTDRDGELTCPDLKGGPVSLLLQVRENTPGSRNGKAYTHVRYKATLSFGPEAVGDAAGSSPQECLARVKEVHGAAGPWAVTGYRIGERALRELGLARHSFDLLVVHRCPAEVQYSCIADGLQAATGASPGKLNLKVEEVERERLTTLVRDRKSGRNLTFTLKPGFARSITNLPHERLLAEGERVAALPDEVIFDVTDTPPDPSGSPGNGPGTRRGP